MLTLTHSLHTHCPVIDTHQVKMDICYLKIKGNKITHLKIRLERNHRIGGIGTYITDIIHVFKANNPAAQSEIG